MAEQEVLSERECIIARGYVKLTRILYRHVCIAMHTEYTE